MTYKSFRTLFGFTGLMVLIVSAVSTSYALSVILSDRVTIHQGDIAYQLTVTSDTIRGFPAFADNARQVAYTYSARDGAEPELIELTYASAVHPDDLATAYRDHCQRQGFETAGMDDTSWARIVRCTASDYYIVAAMRAGTDGKTRVRVSFVSR